LDKIFISLQGLNAKAYKKIVGINVDFIKLLENVIYFCNHRKKCKVYIKLPDIGVDESEKEHFFKLFDKYADELFIEHIIPTWPDFDISDVKVDDGIGYYGTPVDLNYIKVCPLIFYDMVVDFNGAVLPCPVDWIHKTWLGSVKEQSLYSLWNGKELNKLRRIHLCGKRESHTLCGKCVTLQYCNVDNIDNYANELLHRFDTLP
jgi:radical SAM protein with 4Fe4S-binding SPASM domain